MYKYFKILVVIMAVSALLFSTGAKPGTPNNNANTDTNTNTNTNTTINNSNTAAPTQTNMTGTISVSPSQAVGGAFVTVSYTKSANMSNIRVFSVDRNTMITSPPDDTVFTGTTTTWVAPTEVGRYTFRLLDWYTKECVAESNVLEVIEYTPTLVVEKPTYETGDMVGVSLRDGSGLTGAAVYMINADTGTEVPDTRHAETTGRGNMGFMAPAPGKYQMVHIRDTNGKIIARSSIFTVVAKTGAPAAPNTQPTNPANQTLPATPLPADITAPVTGQKNTIVLRIGSPFMTVNGVIEQVDPASSQTTPVVVNSRTLLPIRSIIETLGGSVAWDGRQQKVTVTLGAKTIELWINKKTVNVNGTTKTIDVPPQTINGRTMLPIRFITENLGHSVSWDEKTQQVTLTTS